MSIRRWHLVVASALTFVLASEAAAQFRPPAGVITPEANNRQTAGMLQREFDNDRLMEEPEAAARLHKNATSIAKCMVRRGRSSAGGYVGGVLAGDPGYERIGDALTGRLQACAASNAAATAIAISGALAEELVRAKVPQLADRAPTVDEDDARRFFGDLSGAVTLDNVAGCLAVYSPGLAYKVLAAPVGSAEETAALEAVFKQTPECGMAAPPTSLPSLYQRGALATALYKWTSPAA